MITIEKFTEIRNEIKSALNGVFNQSKDNEHNYITFLAEGEFKPHLFETVQKFNPYTIDNREDRFMDETRLNFFVDFMTQYYSFPKGQESVLDDSYRINLELMIYTHIWESKPFLKKLFRLSTVLDGQPYPWEVQIQDMGKHKFIRETIRPIFDNKFTPLGTILRKCFHTTIRNSFAHSEYSIDEKNKKIWFDSTDNSSWKLESCTFDEWSERFIYSSLFAYLLIEEFFNHRKSLINDFNRNIFTIAHPSMTNGIREVEIKYRPEPDMFNFI